MSKNKSKNKQSNTVQKKLFYDKLPLDRAMKIWYFYVPLIFAILALAMSIFDFEVQVTKRQPQDKKEFSFYTGITEVFHTDRYIDPSATSVNATAAGTTNKTHTSNTELGFIGDPNVIAIIGCITLILCLFFIPKSMLKIREHGDGLGLMFLPLGLMCINNILCSFLYEKDIPIAIAFSVACFIVSAMATFKATIKYIQPLCIGLLAVAAVIFFASFSPYCYNETVSYMLVDNALYASPVKQYYISYFIRDLLTFISFGIFSSFIYKTYSYNEK